MSAAIVGSANAGVGSAIADVSQFLQGDCFGFVLAANYSKLAAFGHGIDI